MRLNKRRDRKDTVSSLVKVPPPKKSWPASCLSDLSLSSSGGNPHVKTCRKICITYPVIPKSNDTNKTKNKTKEQCRNFKGDCR